MYVAQTCQVHNGMHFKIFILHLARLLKYSSSIYLSKYLVVALVQTNNPAAVARSGCATVFLTTVTTIWNPSLSLSLSLLGICFISSVFSRQTVEHASSVPVCDVSYCWPRRRWREGVSVLVRSNTWQNSVLFLF